MISYFEETGEVELRYVDYGGYDKVKVDTLRQIRSLAAPPWPEAVSGLNLHHRQLCCLNCLWVLPQLRREMVGRFVGAAGAGSLRAQAALLRLF